MAIGDFSSRAAARAVALAIAEGRPVTDETGETVSPDGPPYDRETMLEAAAPPWGTHDTFLGAKGIPGGVLYLYSCPAGNYVSVTLKKDS